MIHRAGVKMAWFEVREGIDWPGCVGRLIGSLLGLAVATWFTLCSPTGHSGNKGA